MRAVIDSKIRIRAQEIPGAIYDAITHALSPENPDKARAIAEHVRGAEGMNDTIDLWDLDGEYLNLPRGFASRLDGIAREHVEPLDWEDRMVMEPFTQHRFRQWPASDLRGYQFEARDALLRHGSAILRSPTGSGKSRVCLEAMRWAGQRTIIIVHTTALARQWQESIRTAYGYEAGVVGDGEWDSTRDVTIALWQSIWSRQAILTNDWYRQFGMVIVDEAQHVSAPSLYEIVQRFPAYFRLANSATPEWDRLLLPLVEAAIGPVVRADHQAAKEHLIKPSVVVVKTDFEFEFKRTEMRGHKRTQNNYGELSTALSLDIARNELIASVVREDSLSGHHCLLVTRRLAQVEAIASRLRSDDRFDLHILVGGDGRKAQKIRDSIMADERGSVLLSTVADEALDIPRLDRLGLVFPARKVPLVEQQVGRLMRTAPGKTDAVVYDFYDHKIGVMKGQYKGRSTLYMKRGWKVAIRGEGDA